jgi:peptidoglycan/LPS O-acetylase OafA/YrhL
MSFFKSESKKRLRQLDILRGIAVLLVIGHHVILQPEESGMFQPLVNVLIRFGWSGVDLFFVLSGFLVGGLLFSELRSRSVLDVRRFIIRRGFKIWPAYYAYLLTVFLLLLVREQGNAHRALGDILPNFFHIQNYLGTARPHTWSLAVEEHFYLLLPLLLLLLLKIGGRRPPSVSVSYLPAIAIGVMVLCTGLRYLSIAHQAFDPATNYNPTHLRMDSLFFGVLLGYLYHFKSPLLEKIPRRRYSVLLLGLALVCPMMVIDIRTGWFVTVIGFAMLYVGYGLILLAVVYTPVGEGVLGKLMGSALGRLLAFIGFFSYPIYLWHIDAARLPLQYFAQRGLFGVFPSSWRFILITFIYVIVATAAGVILGTLVEKPALAFRDAFFPSRASALPQPESRFATGECLPEFEVSKPTEQFVKAG